GGMQRRGLGRALLRRVERAARMKGVRQVHLEVRASNAGARVFYGAHGYRELGARPRYYGGEEDAILMARDLPGEVELVVLAGGRGERMGGATKPLLVREDGLTILAA